MSTISKTEKTKTQRVQIELYASHLKNVAGAFKGTSDPYAVVTLLANDPTASPKLIGKTEVIKNSLNPRWTKVIFLDYQFGQLTRFNVGIYDEIRKAKHNKPMGSCMFEVGEILGSRGNLKAKKLRQGGTVFCRITAAPPESHGLLHLGLRGIHLKNVEGLFGKSDPFVEVSASVDVPGGLTWQPILRSEPVMNDLNPIWPEVTLDMGRLCNGNYEKAILITVYDWEKSGKHKIMGQFETTVRFLIEAETLNAKGPHKSVDTSRAFSLRHPRHKKVTGKIVVTSASVHKDNDENRDHDRPSSPALQWHIPVPIPVPVADGPAAKPTFVDYLAGGCELELSIAIDFTGSNGDPRRPGTLHYIHQDGVSLNDYEKAFTSVGSIIGRYDSNQRFPVWGFGAKFGGAINHCFQVGQTAELKGLGEALNAYRQVFKSGFTMSGPTVFAECMDMAAQRARSAQESAERIGKQSYHILLILTDGAVTDIDLTKRSLRNASSAPLSIVIVGLGTANFSDMQFLDDFADSDPNQRDIVQFVEFNKFASNKSALTRETLDEIPSQLVDYFYNKRGIRPLPPVHGSQFTLEGDEPDEHDIDLSIDYTSEDEIVLGDTQVLNAYDDTQYGTAAAYLVPPVPVPSAPYSKESEPYVSSAVYQQQEQQPEPPSVMKYGVPASSSVSYSTYPTPNGNPATPWTPIPPPVAPPRSEVPQQFQPKKSGPFSDSLDPPPAADVFHVQVPYGVYPGEPLQVQNPRTQQYMVVYVPQGVRPGGKFAVAY